jgi:hypothetical protein
MCIWHALFLFPPKRSLQHSNSNSSSAVTQQPKKFTFEVKTDLTFSFYFSFKLYGKTI